MAGLIKSLNITDAIFSGFAVPILGQPYTPLLLLVSLNHSLNPLTCYLVKCKLSVQILYRVSHALRYRKPQTGRQETVGVLRKG